MRNLPAMFVLLFSLFNLSLVSTVFADQLGDGIAAYERGDYKQAYRLFKSLAERGDAYAQTNLAHMYQKGEGVRQDSAEALMWYRKAAAQGFDQAQYNIGVMYESGDSVRRDHAEAAKWYRKAAEQGHDPAMYNLGVAYLTGDGIKQNFVMAYMWFSLVRTDMFSPEMGKDVEKNKKQAASKMTSAQITEAQRLAREQKVKMEK